jgi:hypothetical protein
MIKNNLAIDYGEFGLHLPDVDIIQCDVGSIPSEDNSVDFVFIDPHILITSNIQIIQLALVKSLVKKRNSLMIAEEIHRIMKSEKVMAWLIGAHWRNTSGIQYPEWHERARKYNFYLRCFKYLFTVKKT